MSSSSDLSSNGSSDDICTDPVRALILAPHRIPITVIASFSLSCMLCGTIFLLVQRKTFVYRRKAIQYLALATLGLMLYIKDSLTIVWTYPEYDCDLQSFLMYYLGAVPIHFIPMFLRSWRIFCVYRETINYNCTFDTMMSAKVRRHKWMWARIIILYLPFLVFMPMAIFYNYQDDVWYLWICIEGVYGIANFLLAVKLYTMRSELQEKFIDETSSLIVYATVALIEVVCSNTLYIIATTIENHVIPVYLYVDITLVSLMWFLTGGKAVLQVWKRKGDRLSVYNLKVGELNSDAIEKAKRMLELRNRSVTEDSSSSRTQSGQIFPAET